MSEMTKGERTELKAIVRQQFRVLRKEVKQREAEVLADVEHQIGDSYAEADARWASAAHLAHEAILRANRELNDAFRELTGDAHIEATYVYGQLPSQPSRRRTNLRMEAVRDITARVEGALLRLDRQEADLLRGLAIGVLESEEAQRFLTEIPSVGELVPVARLAELEAGLPTDERRSDE